MPRDLLANVTLSSHYFIIMFVCSVAISLTSVAVLVMRREV